VTLGGIETKNSMYERIPLKAKFLDGKENLVMSLEGCLRLPMFCVICKEIIHARDKENQVYNAIYQLDKQV